MGSPFEDALVRSVTEVWPLSAAQVQALERHFALMLRWNAKLNLTRIIDPVQAARRHFAESLVVARVIPEGAWRVADLGSGAGFPGIPLAVARPELAVTLVEAHHRKSVFLTEATRELPNISVTTCRGEELTGISFDWVVSRAVRWEDVLSPGLARSFAILTTRAGYEEIVAGNRGSTWNLVEHPALAPNVLAVGHA